MHYSCAVRLRNDLEWEEQLHRLRVEFRRESETLFTDKHAFDEKPVVLPPRKWVSVEINHGLRGHAVIEAADSVWLLAETVGDK